ncbi:hypothetical protein N0V83_009020 [Neocucurbitaria cava]|uniref:PH domain-containing protein n=1 Tax=Neocucurbitaria cava TaxID=798079 RepID=A0A9W9CIP7_9PLEO|nr:hypothetical protein N0V83_009020 [Neocucurbitaria cava]
MSAVSAQIHMASGTMPPDDRFKSKNAGSQRNRAQDSSSTSRWRFNRSSTTLLEVGSRPTTSRQNPPASTPTPKLERTPSKMSLFSLFSRPKVERARGHTEVGLAVPMRPQTPPKPTPPVPAPKSSLRQNPSPPAQQTIRARSSQMFRPTSMRPAPVHREFGSWDPPPLFQAFPQSLKHATVQACVFPPEVLMRTQSQRQHAEYLRDRMDSARDLSTIAENSAESKKLEKTHRRLISNAVLNQPTPELVNKIYMLVTAGFVLQYDGDGAFDRLPEKVLKLGKESAAFACDLIPGKHWVLQISSHAHNDGTVEPEPKNTLLSRLRSQNTTTKKAATSFLLVLESAEEMDAWMTSVRKEIDNLGGMKAKDESIRASSSTDESEKKSTETTSHRYLVHRDPNVISKVTPVDSPLQSQYSASPRIVTSDWETDRSVRTASIADSTSGQSGRRDNRQSVDMSSVASTPISQHQIQLDQLRGRSRFSFMSNTTATSGPGTRNTSRDSSPAPQSPLKESFMPTGEAETPRSAMSLKSFHMNPSNNSVASRRRSMQPLPVTNEDLLPSIQAPMKRQRHSLYSPTSPTVPELGKPGALGPSLSSKISAATIPSNDKENTIAHISSCARSITPKRTVDIPVMPAVASQVQTREDSPVRSNTRTFAAPPRKNTISPPPSEPAPLPPQHVKRQSIIGHLPIITAQSTISYSAPSPTARAQRRLSATPKPFLRPFPVRPQAQHGDSSMIVPRRQSSLTPTSAPAPLPLGINVNRSVTAPARPPSAAANMTPTSHPNTLHSASQSTQPLRRPRSVQIRTDPAPFLSAPRPVRAIQSTPSFVPGRRSSNGPTSAPRQLQATPSIDTLRQQALAQQTQQMAEHQAQQKVINSRRSMPAIGLPPPVPPPNMPLPPPPPNMPLPTLPPSMSQRTPPPNMPLPPPPPTAESTGVAL